MPLSANSRLGPYEIKSVLGVGGMGEVYRARDSRLNRDVAIKVLRSDSTATPELKSRFEREARAVAALNHPNIVSVFDFGIDKVEGAEAQYIVSELIEGESLRQVIAGKPLATRRLVDIAVQIADGLAAAHASGIVHRDLKPENILLTKDGRGKILDFGLARQTTKTVHANSSDETFLPSSNQNLTSAGAILGTASYMSPEQAVGREMDYRSDQFSFGLILHEMATGKQAFARNSSVETMAAIVRDEPPPIEEKLPAPLKWIIDRCLNKEPEQRYESTRDLYRDLKSLRDHFSDAYSSSGVLVAVPATPRSLRWKLLTSVATVCLLIGALIAYLLKPTGEFIQKYKYSPMAVDVFSYVWSPDGKAVAYSASVNGTAQIFLRHLSSPVPLQLTHGNYDAYPQGWSSDRNHIIVIEHVGDARKLYSVPIVGGDPEFIMDIFCVVACDLSRDGKVWAEFMKDKDGYYRVAISDPLGTPFRVYTPAPFATKALYGHPFLAFSPDGKKILLFRGDDKENETWLLPYPAGSGPPHRVFEHGEDYADPQYSWLPDNRHVVVGTLAGEASSHLWLADTESRDSRQLTTGTSDELQPLVSPDGKSILYLEASKQVDITSISLQDGSAKALITTGHNEFGAAWSANSAKMAWVTDRSGDPEIWVRTADGSERPIVTIADFPPDSTGGFTNPSLSPDGERVIFVQAGTGIRLWIKSLSGGDPIRLTNDEQGNEYGGCWSPDGSRFVYQRYRNGSAFLMSAKTSGGGTPTTLKENTLNYLPSWSPTGEWITYRDEKGWNIISPDGKNSKSLGNLETQSLAFAKDGKLLYGILAAKVEYSKDPVLFFSLDPATLKQNIIRDLSHDLKPSLYMWPSVRFSVAPDGKSLIYSTGKSRSDLWMLQGYRQPGFWNQRASAFSPKGDH